MEDLEASVAKLTQKAELLCPRGCGSAPAQMGWTWHTAHSGLHPQLWHLILKSNQSFKPLQSSCHCTSASHSSWEKLLNYSSAASEWWHNPPWFTALEQTWKVWYSCSPSNPTIRVCILFILWVCLATGRSTWIISEHYFMWCKRNWPCSYNQITSCQGPCVNGTCCYSYKMPISLIFLHPEKWII